VIEIGAWFDPEKAQNAASTLVEQLGADVLAFTEDSPSTIQYAQSYYEQNGVRIPVFSHYSPMYSYGKDVVPSGEVVRWGIIYKDILAKIYAGLYTTKNLENVDYWYLLDTDAVDIGAQTYEDSLWVNPSFKSDFNNSSVVEKFTGETMSLMDLVVLRYQQMKDKDMTFDPFTGPLTGRWWLGSGGTVLGKQYANGETINIPTGIRLGHDELWNMGWFLESVVVQE
jgi:simple sugar transport system substrate-binding protein